jgi:hypothetical protein
MQGPPNPTEKDEASVPTEPVPDGPHSSGGTVILRRKAANRTLPSNLVEGELDLLSSSPPPRAGVIPARKKRRLEKPLPTTTDEAARKTASTDVSVDLPPPAVDNDVVNADPVTDTQTNFKVTLAFRRWILEEDAKLTRAVANTSKKKWGNEYKTDWDAVAALVPGRTAIQCRRHSWKEINRTTGRRGTWTEDEDSKLKDTVQTHGDKNWCAIAALIPGRSRGQCRSRWYRGSVSSIDRANGRAGKWTEDEDTKLKDAVQTHGGKNWCAIAALVPDRSISQCRTRWHNGWANGPKVGKWAEDEDIKLKDAMQTHGGKNWCAIAGLILGRTTRQCQHRWKLVDPNRSFSG